MVGYAETYARLVVIWLYIQRTVGVQPIVVWLLERAVGIFAFYHYLLDRMIVESHGGNVWRAVAILFPVSASCHAVIMVEPSEEIQVLLGFHTADL